MKKIINNEEFLELTSGEQTRDFIYVKDVVTAFEQVLISFDNLQPFQEFEIGTGKSYPIKELVTIIKEAAKSSTVLKFGALPYREGEIMESFCNNSALKILGWEVETSIQTGIMKVVNFEKK